MRQPTRNELRAALSTLKRLEATAPFVMPSGTPRGLFYAEVLALTDVRDLLAALTGEHADIVPATPPVTPNPIPAEVTCDPQT